MITDIMLIVYVTMAGDLPDYHRSRPMPTLEACWRDASAWVSTSEFEATRQLAIPDSVKSQVTGLAATCKADITGDEE